MAKDYRKEISFQAGELSPLFHGRSDSEFYQKGLAVAKNVVIDKRGGATRRKGARHRNTITGVEGKILTKQINPWRFDILTMVNAALSIYAPGNAFTSANLLTDGKFDTPGAGAWTVVQTTWNSDVVFTGEVCKLLPKEDDSGPTFGESSIRQQVTVTASTSANHTVRVEQATSRRLHIKIGTTAGSTNIAEFFTTEEFFDGEFVPNNATYWVEVLSDSEFGEEGSVLTHVATLASANLGGAANSIIAPWVEDEIPDVHVIESPDGETTYFVHRSFAPQKLTYNYATDVYTFAAVTFTAAPANWTTDNYPESGAYFQGRLWLGPTHDSPQKIWASRSGAPENFTTGATASDSFNLTIEKQGRVKWLRGQKNLVVGTENGEHIISATEDGVITQDNFLVRQQSAYGSNKVQSIPVAEKIFYITPDGERLQSMGYQWEEDNWLSNDLTFASEHITYNGVRKAIFAQDKRPLVILTLINGNMAVLTYDRTTETIGWAYHVYEKHRIVDCAAGLVDGETRLVRFVIKRDGSLAQMSLEREISEDVYMDGFSQDYNNTPDTRIDGLDHLDGETVQVMADGVQQADEVVSFGRVFSDTAGTVLYAGLKIESKIVTLPPDVAQEQIRSWIKRWLKIWILVNGSQPPKINGDRVSAAAAEQDDVILPDGLENSAFKISNLGWDDNGQLTVEEDTPVEMKVLAIYGELARETL